MLPITKEQIHLAKRLMQVTDQLDMQHNMAKMVSDNRTDNIETLTIQEAEFMIEVLYTNHSLFIERVWQLGYEAGIIRGESLEDLQINKAILDNFVNKKTRFKKGLNSLLGRTDRQITVLRSLDTIIKRKHEREAIKATKELLKQLKITVQNI